VASQYERSYATGQMDQETADKRLETIGQRVQSAQQFAQTQSGLDQQRQMMNDMKQQQLAFQQQGLTSSQEYKNLMAQIAQGQLDLRRATEANKPEKLSYIQQKDFDVVRRSKEEALNAESSEAIVDKAAPLLPQAFGSKGEAIFKGVLSATTPMTFEAKNANDQLIQYGQQLALKTPKFSGPTSDADAKRYDAAVGDLSNPSKSLQSKTAALKDIKELAQKAKDYATQQENYFFGNNKSLRGFKYEDNPFGK
jgi:vacuolar-type H+-ATPase subunit I/STV1